MILTAIPTRDRFDLLAPLLTSLLSGNAGELVLVMDNGYSEESRKSLDQWAAVEPNLLVADCHGQSIYQMWNFAIDFANEIEARFLCLLNDDVAIPTYGVQALAKALDNDPELWVVSPNYHGTAAYQHPGVRYVTGTYKNGGMAGFAFMFDPSRPLRFDEAFQFWGGDDDFAHQVTRAGGKIGIVMGLACEHHGGATSGLHPEVDEMISADVDLMRERGLW